MSKDTQTAKPAEVKPAEVKPAVAPAAPAPKPAETKPAEAKPAVAEAPKPAETTPTAKPASKKNPYLPDWKNFLTGVFTKFKTLGYCRSCIKNCDKSIGKIKNSKTTWNSRIQTFRIYWSNG